MDVDLTDMVRATTTVDDPLTWALADVHLLLLLLDDDSGTLPALWTDVQVPLGSFFWDIFSITVLPAAGRSRIWAGHATAGTGAWSARA